MLSGDNSILQKATDAKQISERAEAKEQAQIDIMAWITDKTANNENSSLDDSKVKTILTGKSYVKNGQPGNESFITAKGEYEIPYSELYTASDTILQTTIPAGTYTVGQEIVYNGTQFLALTSENANSGEHFYVVADDGNSVRLLAKYCLNQEGTAQTDKDTSFDTYGRNFSQTNYWSDNFTSRPFDLQSEEMITEAKADGTTIQNAVLTAMKYGEDNGVTGRLMTKAEANSMKSSNSQILFGKWTDGTQPTQGFYWYLGNADTISDVYYVYGGEEEIDTVSYSEMYPTTGVRPVLIVPED